MEVKYQVVFIIDNCISSSEASDDCCIVRDSQGRSLFNGSLSDCLTWITDKMSEVRIKVGKEVSHE